MVKNPSAWPEPTVNETSPDDYVIELLNSPNDVSATEWNTLLLSQSAPTPFMRHEYLSAMHRCACADVSTGWSPHFFLLHRAGQLVGATLLYLKSHSRGEYVFDWSWAQAYAQHGLAYYPKALCAVPFTPVPGSRLLARSAADRAHLAGVLVNWCRSQKLSGLHCLFVSDEDAPAMGHAGMLARHTVQFHWKNTLMGYASFDDFLASLSQEKRKKIRQERRKVADAGVQFRALEGSAITAADWDFFYRCYERTYLEHGNAPYLSRDFFHAMANTMPEDWVLFIAERNGQDIASSLIASNASMTRATGSNSHASMRVAYGRYWGALERVDCLHFEACYYQPLVWCIANGYQRFEGGAQGEHKLARALLPVTTTSMHWLAHPQFFGAVNDFLTRERDGIADYMSDLQTHSPFKQS
jgi:predicted N-acyltransferase